MWLALFFFTTIKAQKFEGLALTPSMGWNSWNTFQTNIREQLAKQTADAMVTSGMKDAGYRSKQWMLKKSITGFAICGKKQMQVIQENL